MNLHQKVWKHLRSRGAVLSLLGILCLGVLAGGCGGESQKTAGNSSSQVVIYSNADDEAVNAMKKTLDENGYKGQYLFKTFGTNELGGKILAEGKNIEADMVTMSSYYLDSAQKKDKMFKELQLGVTLLQKYPSYYAPFLANQGALIVNTKVLQENHLPMPKSVKDLADPVYKGQISVVDIQGSSTAWLMIQSLIAAYGEDETRTILKGIYANAGKHLEQSGSGPIKKVRAGEVAIGFGLRHQAVADKAKGLPIDYVDPAEGNYTLTESLAVVDHKGSANEKKAMEMVKVIIEKGRGELIKTYPVPLYQGEKSGTNAMSSLSKVFPEPLTVELLKKHLDLSQECK